MSFFEESFTCDIKNVRKKHSFSGAHTSLPSKKSNDILIDQNAAYELVSSKVGKYEAGWVAFYDVDTSTITNSKIKAAEAKMQTAISRRHNYTVVNLEKAVTFTTRTCTCCGKKIYMDDYRRPLNALKREKPLYYISQLSCTSCRSTKSVPFTAPQRIKYDNYQAIVSEMFDAVNKAKYEHIVKLANKGKIKTKALVLGVLHESLKNEYNDEY